MLNVVGEVCGIHAQVQSSAELQLWSRVNRVTAGDVRAALWEERSLIRTWCMRGTLHLLLAEDAGLYVAALRQHDRWWKGAWLRMVGMTEPELRAVLEAIRESPEAEPITREALAEKVAARAGPKGRDRMIRAGARCSSPRPSTDTCARDRRAGRASPSYARIDGWASGPCPPQPMPGGRS